MNNRIGSGRKQGGMFRRRNRGGLQQQAVRLAASEARQSITLRQRITPIVTVLVIATAGWLTWQYGALVPSWVSEQLTSTVATQDTQATQPTQQTDISDDTGDTTAQQSVPGTVAHTAKTVTEAPPAPQVPFSEIARIMAGPAQQNVFPDQLNLVNGSSQVTVSVNYGFHAPTQEKVEEVLAHYKPDYGVFFAMDPDIGRVLAMASYSKVAPELGNLAIRASYPAASVFKIVTAAAAIENGSVTADTVIPYNGKSTALYKKHVLRHKDNKWTRHPTMREAFGKSVNPVFGRLGVFQIGGETLGEYAHRFGFNKALESDLPFEDSLSTLDPLDQWQVAEAASGYTRRNKMSPVHGAMIAASIANDGVMMRPYLVESLVGPGGDELYRSKLAVAGQPVTEATAQQMRKLMRTTVKSGSARKAFRGFFTKEFANVEIGGKTGSLTGNDPKGRNEWFVGYAIDGNRKIAFAVLTVNIEKWTVKPAHVARRAIEAYMRERDIPSAPITAQADTGSSG